MEKNPQIVIPMAGRGDRFAQSGYGEVKAMIPIEGRPMLEHVLGMFPGERDVLFICARDHLQSTTLRKDLKRVAPYGTIAAIEPHKRGPLHSVMAARHLIHDEQPVLIAYCDSVSEWDYDAFLKFVRKTNCDACAPSHRGFHPQTLGPNVFGFINSDGDKFKEVRARKRYQADPMQEISAVGMYYFRTGALMKQYLEKTDKLGLTIDGEYFPALALNVMAGDGLNVRTYEVERFMQWETPEDLRVYERWSQHFAKDAEWQAKTRMDGTTVFTIAGLGERFSDAGFKEPKPAILADGEPMLARAARCLPRTKLAVAVISSSVERWAGLEAALSAPERVFDKIVIPGTTEGQLATCLRAHDRVPADKPLMIAPCDAAPVIDEREWTKLQNDLTVDFAVWTFRDHPHASRNPQQYSWATHEKNGRLKKVSLRKGLGSTPSLDTGLTGIFWFRRAGDFFTTAQALIAKGQKIEDEFLVEAVLPELMAAGKVGKVFPVSRFVSFGTPDELRTYSYYAAYFRARNREQARKVG